MYAWMPCRVFSSSPGRSVGGVLLFSGGYFTGLSGSKAGTMYLRMALFLGTMAGVFLADDAYFFMLSWESMALVSFSWSSPTMTRKR